MSSQPWILAAFAALAAMLAALSLAAIIGILRDWRSRRSVAEALRDLESLQTQIPSHVVLRKAESADRPLRLLFAGIPGFRGAEDNIARAGMNWSVEKYVIHTAGWALVLGLLTWTVTRSPIPALVALLVGAWLPRAIVKRRGKKRVHALESQLPGAIDHLQRAVRAGHPLSAGLKMLSDESPEPIATEFRAVFEEQRFGLPFEDALLGLGDRIDLPDVRILITAILVQREVGGNLAETLEKVGNTMRSRFNIRRQVRVYTAQGRMSGYVLAGLPIVVGIFIYLVNPDYMGVLFTHPIGKALMGVALCLQLFGYMWIRKIVDVEY